METTIYHTLCIEQVHNFEYIELNEDLEQTTFCTFDILNYRICRNDTAKIVDLDGRVVMLTKGDYLMPLLELIQVGIRFDKGSYMYTRPILTTLEQVLQYEKEVTNTIGGW